MKNCSLLSNCWANSSLLLSLLKSLRRMTGLYCTMNNNLPPTTLSRCLSSFRGEIGHDVMRIKSSRCLLVTLPRSSPTWTSLLKFSLRENFLNLFGPVSSTSRVINLSRSEKGEFHWTFDGNICGNILRSLTRFDSAALRRNKFGSTRFRLHHTCSSRCEKLYSVSRYR